ncbi:MAG: SGNH/GDSL hydrolase family protein [Comamonas sp.]
MQTSKNQKIRWAAWTCVAAAAALLSACGGGSSDGDVNRITSVKVMGDSLADSGTFGYKFTVQSAQPTGQGSTALWTDQIATQYGTSLCAHYRFSGGSFAPQAGCSNYAVGGGRINATAAAGSPLSIPQQLRDAAAQGYGKGDLVLLDGGGNDAADLVTSYLIAAVDQGASLQQLLATKLDAATLQALLAIGPSALPEAGGLYMQALAKDWAANIRSQVLDQGAPRVAVLNVPDISLTPKLQLVLQQVTQQQGEEAAQQLQALISGWVQTFNQQLAASLAGDSRVVIADFFAELNNQVRQPQKYGYTNVNNSACAPSGMDAQGLPSYDLASCTAAGLSAHIPAGESAANWWQSYVFSDDFHPTSRGHAQLGKAVAASLAQAGWK